MVIGVLHQLHRESHLYNTVDLMLRFCLKLHVLRMCGFNCGVDVILMVQLYLVFPLLAA